MIDCNYYKNNHGPNVTLAQIWGEEGRLDITDHIKEFYGHENNWQGKLYKYNDIFPKKYYKYKFRVEFSDDTGRKYWFHGIVGEPEHYFNPPIFI